MLAEHFLAKSRESIGKPITKIADEALELMCAYDWPGNVRELENVIERAVALESSNVILLERLTEKILHFGESAAESASAGADERLPEEGLDFDEQVATLEKQLLASAMTRAGGVQTKAAKLLQMNLRSFRYLLQKYSLR